MRETISLTIEGLGIIFYSPSAASHIAPGEDYLESHFWEPEEVARHVNECRISAFGTGSPGCFVLELYDGPIDSPALARSKASARLGIEVQDERICFRDLYELIAWTPEYPATQTVNMPNG